MKKVFLILLLLLIPIVLAETETFTTRVNISITNDTIEIYGEDGSLSSFSKASVTDTFVDVNLDRDFNKADIDESLDNISVILKELDLTYDELVAIYNTSLSNQSNYYPRYTECFFQLIALNDSNIICKEEREYYQNETRDKQTSIESCTSQRDDYSGLYDDCTVKKQTAESKEGQKWLFGIIAFAIGAGGVYLYFTKFSEKKKVVADANPLSGEEGWEFD